MPSQHSAELPARAPRLQRPLRERAMLILWPAFVMAGVLEMLVFVVVDPASVQYLKGATVDFVESLQESGFKIDNPNASGSCGCGHSFQVADGDRLDGSAVQNAGCSH